MTLLVLCVVILLLGPLRHWAGRHWALLVSVAGGAVSGFVLGAVLAGQFGAPAFLPLLAGLIGALAAGQSGPAWLRHIEKDGKDE